MTQSYVFGDHEPNTLQQLQDVADGGAAYVALMADGHWGYNMPVGGVAAYRNKVSVSGVGFDIACGTMAVQTELTLDDIGDDLEAIADEIYGTFTFGMGGANRCDDAPRDDPLFDLPQWLVIPNSHRRSLRERARAQLGTIGGGNHYIDVFEDEADGSIWIGVHFGSRGLGHTIASAFLAISAGGKWGDRATEKETLLDIREASGAEYDALMRLAGFYAYAGRAWVVGKVQEILGSVETRTSVHNHHNFSWPEKHFGEVFFVVRKGATPAFPGQRGFVGGSMGDNAVILEGTNPSDEIGRDAQQRALYSTVHGAGRVMSRTAAAGKWKYKRNKPPKLVRPGAVSQAEMDEWVQGRGVILRGAGLDESPQAYRRLPDVLEAQGDTIKVLHNLRPIIVAMAPPKTRW